MDPPSTLSDRTKSDDEAFPDDSLYPMTGRGMKEMIRWIRRLENENTRLSNRNKDLETIKSMHGLAVSQFQHRYEMLSRENRALREKVATLTKALQDAGELSEDVIERMRHGDWKRCSWFSTPVTKAFLHHAEDQFEAGKHTEALTILDRFLGEIISSIHRVEAKLLKAVILRDSADPQKALKQCEEAIGICKNYRDDQEIELVWSKAHLYLGMCLYELGRYGEASIAFSCVSHAAVLEQADTWLALTTETLKDMRLCQMHSSDVTVAATEEGLPGGIPDGVPKIQCSSPASSHSQARILSKRTQKEANEGSSGEENMIGEAADSAGGPESSEDVPERKKFSYDKIIPNQTEEDVSGV